MQNVIDHKQDSKENSHSIQLGFWVSFCKGFFKPSLTSLLVACGTAVAVFCFCQHIIIADMLSDSPQYLLATGISDSSAYATADILNYANRKEHEKPAIILIGASAFGKAIFSKQGVKDLIKTESGLDVDVITATTGGQSLYDSIAAMDKLSANFKGIIILDVNFIRLARSKQALYRAMKSVEFGFTSEAIDKEAGLTGRKVPTRTGIYLWDNKRFTLPRLPYLYKTMWTKRVRPDIHHIKIRKTTNRNQLADNFYQKIKFYDKNATSNLAALERAINRLQSNKNTKIILLEPPFNPKYTANTKTDNKLTNIVRNRYKTHIEFMSDFAKRKNLLYLNPTKTSKLSESDFVDYCHIGNIHARRRFTTELCHDLTIMLNKHFTLENN